VSHRETDPNWLTAELARAEVVWVSSDSVSMIYEALTAGAAVGVIDVPARRRDRITAIAGELATRGTVTLYEDWGNGTALTARAPLAEARRCADLILAAWDPATRTLRPQTAE
jgi:hypothetical protein